jgi:hypothetical protein
MDLPVQGVVVAVMEKGACLVDNEIMNDVSEGGTTATN